MPPARRKPPAAGKGAAAKQQPAAEPEPEQPAEQPPPSKRVPRSLFLDQALLERARAAVTWLAAFVPDSGVRSLSDVFEPGAWTEVERLEKEYNDGKPFKPVAKMPTGRPRE